MKSTNIFIIILIIILLVLSGILVVKILNDKNKGDIIQNVNYSEIDKNIESVEENTTNVDNKTAELLQEGMDYAEEKSEEAKDKLNIESEKEKITLAVGMAMFGNNTAEQLTYNNLNEQLKENLGDSKYVLTGPDSDGNYIVKIDTRTYTIDKNGAVKD